MMNFARLSCAVLALFATSACETTRDEFGVSEGFVSRHADKVFVATTQEQRADRYLLASLIVAPLALDTTSDETGAQTTILYLDALYGALAAVYGAVYTCSTSDLEQGCANTAATPVSEKTGNLVQDGYSFETLSYEVQSDLYFLGKSGLMNLDLDDKVKDLIDLNPKALVTLLDNMSNLVPALRRGLASYRDGIVIYTDAVCGSNASCDERYDKRYAALGTLVDGDGNNLRGLTAALNTAQSVSEKSGWTLNLRQRYAVLSHIDKACKRAAKLADEKNLSCLKLNGRTALLEIFKNMSETERNA